MKKKILLFALLTSIIASVIAQPVIEKQQVIGKNSDDALTDIYPMRDGGGIVGVYSYLNASGDKTEDNISSTLYPDYLVVKLESVSAQAVNEQDSLALVDLYDSTNGADWYNNSGWLTGPITTWYGVTVTGTTVTEINLVANNLNGKIPSSIGNLANLDSLGLSSNHQLSGNIPSSIGNLVNLTWLNLSYNQLSGSIPSSIDNLVNLTWLNLSYNQLSGSIPSSTGNLVN